MACLLPLVTKLQNFFVILEIEIFYHLLNTLIAIKCFYIFNLFYFSDTFFLHTFFLTKNVISCDQDVNKNYLKHT